MTALQALVLLMVGVMGTGVVLTRRPFDQALVVTLYGLLLTVLFLLFQAPDVALSQLVVGAVVLPLMILLALAKMREFEEEQKEGSGR